MNKEHQIRSLACHQIYSLINKGIWIDELKKEWYRRWKLEFPYYKDISGIRKMGG